MGKNREQWCAGGMSSCVAESGWNVSACTSGGITEAQPFKGFTPSGKVRRGSMYGTRFASSDEAFKAMHEYGYGVRYFCGPSYFIYLRLPRRVRRHIADNPRRRISILKAVLPADDYKLFCDIRRIHGAAGHDAELVKSAESRRPRHVA